MWVSVGPESPAKGEQEKRVRSSTETNKIKTVPVFYFIPKLREDTPDVPVSETSTSTKETSKSFHLYVYIVVGPSFLYTIIATITMELECLYITINTFVTSWDFREVAHTVCYLYNTSDWAVICHYYNKV